MAPVRCTEVRGRGDYDRSVFNRHVSTFRYRLTRFACIGPTTIHDRFDASTRDKVKIVDLVNGGSDVRDAIILSVVLLSPTSREDFLFCKTRLVSLRALDFKCFCSPEE